MESHKQISIRMLRDTVNSVLDFIEQELGQSTVTLPANFYWTVPDDALYAMGSPPDQLDCGSLNDDAEFVEAAHASREQAIPLLLVHAAPLLYALARSLPSYVSPTDRTD